MSETNWKGDVGEAMILADLRRGGHGVAIPFGHDLPFDLVVIRRDGGTLERMQCKYTTSDGCAAIVRVESNSAWVHYRYTAEAVDWLGVYDATTETCLYIPAWVWNGKCRLNLRLRAPANGQRKGIWFADDFRDLVGHPHTRRELGDGGVALS